MKVILEKVWLLYFIFIILCTFQYQNFKIVLLSLILFSVFKIKKIHRFSLLWFSLYFFYNVIFLSFGVIKNPIILKYYIISNVVSIIIYFILFNIRELHTIKILEKLEKIYEYSFYIQFFISLIMYLRFNHYITFDFLGKIIENVIDVVRIERPGQYTKTTVTTNFLVVASFIIPYLTTKYYFDITTKYYLKIILWTLTFFIFFMITLRKIQIIIFGFILILQYVYLKILNNKKETKKIKKIYLILIVISIILISLNFRLEIINISNLVSYILKSFNYSMQNIEYSGVKERMDQFKALINGFFQNISTFLIGNGVGSNAKVIRSNIPGNYELTYVAMLFQRGILGTAIYFIFIFTIFYKYYKLLQNKKLCISEKKYILKYFSGLIGILIATASNPGLNSFEYNWMLYINIFIIVILDKRRMNYERNNTSWRKWNKTLSNNKSNIKTDKSNL